MSADDFHSREDEQTKARSAPHSEETRIRGLEEGADGTSTRVRGHASGAREATGIREIEQDAAAPGTRVRVRPQDTFPESVPERPAELAPGAVIKQRFLLEETIGRGGMGVVYRALDRSKEIARNPHPHVAIKVLNADFRGHSQSLMALEREASKAQSLAHPNIVTVFDFDLAGDTPFITMELLEGSSLERVITSAGPGGLGRSKAVGIIRGIAEGLAYAHRKGIVHCDLKPGNVFLLKDGTPKILDFGIARAVPAMQGRDADEDVFDAGALGAYTEAYATQEMVVGSDPSPADDVYALGLIAYELLSGRHPFGRQGAGKARELALRPRPIKALKRREWKTLERCLAFDVQRRPRDAAEFIRLFYGVTPLAKTVLAAAVAALAIVSAYLWYANFEEAGPAVPLTALPAATQQQVLSLLNDGRTEWSFYEKDHNMMQLWSAVDRYAEAYRLHPRNRDAVKGLKRAADELLDRTDIDANTKREAASALEEKSEYLSRYKPVVDAAGGH